MLTTIDFVDYTSLINPNSPHQKQTISEEVNDHFPEAQFTVTDVNREFNFKSNQEVIMWDENFPPEFTFSGIAIPAPPSMNLIVNPIFGGFGYTNSQGYVASGTFSSLVTFQQGDVQMAFANQTYATLPTVAACSTVVSSQYLATVTPNQQYCFSVYCKTAATATNLKAYFQVSWYDSGQTLISSTSPSDPAYSFAPPVLNGIERVSNSFIPPSNAMFASLSVGVYPTVSGLNSGTVQFSSLQFEPMMFASNNQVSITYPTPDINAPQDDCILMPNGTTSRRCRRFCGPIKIITKIPEGTTRYHIITCGSTADLLDRVLIDATYTNIYDSQIINNIVSTNAAGILGTGSPNIDIPPTVVQGASFTSKPYNNQSFRDILNDLISTSGYAYTVDPYYYIQYHPSGWFSSTITISDNPTGSQIAAQNYVYDEDSTQLRNSIKVIGGKGSQTVQNTLSGTGSQTTFLLTDVPISLQTITVGGVQQSASSIGKDGVSKLGVNGITILWSDGKQNIVFQTAPAAGSGNIIVTYSKEINVSVVVNDQNSIQQYGNRSMKVVDTSIGSTADAQLRGQQELAKNSQPHISVTFDSNTYFPAGYSLFLNSIQEGYSNLFLLVNKVTTTFLGAGVYQYSYSLGNILPNIYDMMRNTKKAVAQGTAAAGTAPVLLLVNEFNDKFTLSENIIGTAGDPTNIAYYGSATYGYCQVI